MFDRLLGFKVHHYLQALGLFIIAFGLPMNKVLMSIGSIWIIANLIIHGKFNQYVSKWKEQPLAWFIAGLIVLQFIGLLYTDDLQYAFKDIRIKLPFYVIPLSLIALPVEKKFFRFILYGFLLSLLITSSINYKYMLEYTNLSYREYSLFGSHIRYSLLIVSGILVSLYFFLKKERWYYLFIIPIVWFSFYTYISQVANGYIAFSVLVLCCLIFYLFKISNKVLRYTIITTALLAVGVGGYKLYDYLRPVNYSHLFEQLPETTKLGNPYYHDTTSKWFENCHPIRAYICENELEKEWNNISSTPYTSKLDCGYPLSSILIRYMTSKGFTKDAEGMAKMTKSDIQRVENCVPTLLATYPPLKKKLAKVKNELFQYAAGGDPDGNSLLERITHWKAGISIIQNNWLFGVGTGDVQNAFNSVYKKSYHKLDKDNWDRAHNQFLTYWITYGIIGFLLFIALWGWMIHYATSSQNLIGIIFSLIAIISFLSEDTIETQQGVTFIGFFIGISYLISWYREKK